MSPEALPGSRAQAGGRPRPIPAEMRAAVCPRYGPPEVVELRHVAVPIPTADQVLIRVRATTVGPADCAFRSGSPAVARLYSGLRRPRLSILGDAVSGEVVVVGADVGRFAQGDRVFGLSPKRLGTHAEYACLAEDGLLAPLPPVIGHDAAVSILEAATALTFLRDVADVRPGEAVLVNGASGSVGGYAVQLARHFGARVTGVCSTRNVEHVAALGADEVIDYTAADFAAAGARYDVVFDAVGTSSFSHCRAALNPTGRYLTTVPSLAAITWMLFTAMAGGRKARFAATGLMQSTDNLAVLAGLFEAGVLAAIVHRTYELADIAEAYRYVETGRKTGTVVVVPRPPGGEGPPPSG